MMLALFTALPMLWRIVSVVAVVVAIGGAFAGWSIHEYNKGWNAAINAVAAKDQAAVSRVKQGEGDIAACRSSGGTWDVTTGACTK